MADVVNHLSPAFVLTHFITPGVLKETLERGQALLEPHALGLERDERKVGQEALARLVPLLDRLAVGQRGAHHGDVALGLERGAFLRG